MKKTYIKPTIEILDAESEFLICGSDDIISEKGIDYGGVDEVGVKDPDAREYVFDRGGGSSAWEEW